MLALSTTVLMARHGTHDEIGRVLSGRTDIALNAEGRDQAQVLGEWLCRASIDRVYTSPRRRARETAQIVADRCELHPIHADDLDELDFGEWAGRSFAELSADSRWQLWNAARGRASTPSGETMAGATSRAMRHLEACEGIGVVLCVSHCDIIRGVVAHCIGLDADHALSFDINPASVTTIRLTDGSGQVVSVNERVC